MYILHPIHAKCHSKKATITFAHHNGHMQRWTPNNVEVRFGVRVDEVDAENVQ